MPSTHDRAVEAVENCGESSPTTLVTAILAYFSREDLIDFVERYIDDTIDQDEDEDEDEERHIVGYDEDGDPIYEPGPEDGDLVHVED